VHTSRRVSRSPDEDNRPTKQGLFLSTIGRLRDVSEFGCRIRPYVESEILAACQAEARGRPDVAFSHLERAHILGQASTVEHVRAHWHMLLWGIRQRHVRECLGQLLRIVGAAISTAVGPAPQGNTGGTNVNPFKRMPIPPELAARLEEARTSGR
jgi:hypothetical protein